MIPKLNFDHKRVQYKLEKDGSFVIENYNFAKPFSSFFPGIAGLYGIPMWVFYVNRGQGIVSFGIHSKDEPILEFQPANKAYQTVFQTGFRTFIKLKDKGAEFYEPFQNNLNNLRFMIKNRMKINFFDFTICEENQSLGLETSVNYFTIPQDNFSALVRVLTVKNTTSKDRNIEIIDGLPALIPYGLNNMFLKDMSRTIEAWMGVENVDKKAPFYRLRAEPADRPEVAHIEKGNFFIGFCQDKNNTELIKPIVDPGVLFGSTCDLSYPFLFLKDNKFSYPQHQILQNKTPCAFLFKKLNLRKGCEFKLYSIVGNMKNMGRLNSSLNRISSVKYIETKKLENEQLIKSIMNNTLTVSSSQEFNQYAQGTFLDNIIRGGLPVTVDKDSASVAYVYSRKHGDLERDYNRFVTQPTYFSEGNGNYRDVNQNRRNDVFFNPDLGDSNIIQFFNLLQLDGYNPLIVKGVRYYIKDNSNISKIVNKYLGKEGKESLSKFLSKPFFIGELFMFIEEEGIKIKSKREDFVKDAISLCEKQEEAEHGEGFWSDHWTYNLDLLESYLALFPERAKEILLDKREFSFFDDYHRVNPRSKKYVLYHNKPRQLHSVAMDKEKREMIFKREFEPHKVRTSFGKGDIYKTNLLTKIVVLILNKMASLDPSGVGIEMEANKPNWYDALNGLPALFGSSISETMELKRLVIFLKEKFKVLDISSDYELNIPQEIYDFYANLNVILRANSTKSDFDYWDKSSNLKEKYREEVVFGISGKESNIRINELMVFLDNCLNKLESAIRKSYNSKDKTFNTYFINELVEFERIDKAGSFIKPLKFKQSPLPLFLEGFMHALKIARVDSERKDIYNAVRKSELYDKALCMYKVNASLDGQSEEIGRAKAFTPGWLENESIWLHMDYKYLLEILKSGLYEEFYKEFFNILIPFQNPQRYGRSILENSSFLVSSVFIDKGLHGTGFVARLSGSTGEFMSLWLLMNLGEEPFYIDEKGELCLSFKPILSKCLFTNKKTKINFLKKELVIDKDCYAFNFLGRTLVVYHNPKRLNTYGKNKAEVKSIVLEGVNNNKIQINSSVIDEKFSYDVRRCKFSRIDVMLS